MGSLSRGSMAQKHVDKTLAIVDGLFAGYVYLDTTEPATTQKGLSRNKLRNGLSQELRALCNEEAHTREAADTRPYSTNNDHEQAWSSIRAVRHGIEALWEHFIVVAAELDNVAIKSIIDDYKDAKGLRQTGVIALRNISSGPVPDDLCKIFAFCCLSYVVSHLLYARGRLSEVDILAGIHLWFHALGRDDEREAFRLLVQVLWPEARGRLDFPINEYPEDARIANGSTHPFQSENISSWLINSQPADIPSTDVQSLTYLEQDFDLSLDLPDPSITHPEPPSAHWHDFSTSLPCPMDIDTNSIDDQQTNIPWASAQLPAADDPLDPFSYHEPPSRSVSIMRADLDRSSELQQTSLYRAVIQYIEEDFGFWYNLSGRGIVSKDFRDCLAWSQERLSRKIDIQTSFIQPLSSERDNRDSVSNGMVAIVEAFVERGLLQDHEEISSYISWAGPLLFDDPASFREFRGWIDSFCPSPSPPPEDRTQSSTNKLVAGLSFVNLNGVIDRLPGNYYRALCADTLPHDPST
ncbi:hypothetical protein FLONG3_5840 [Fusarium longipes]|uniref:Uncharacterized protein n=1 Tax=Fusarium longipes TaxID=694270 RepID=A0A395SS29_9HYPO|nr:hypothetical protein FLONG3_5840 [Fusarium longipes]